MLTNVFVFGTLKDGFPNFEMNSGTKLQGSFITVVRYPFYLVGERHSPWLVNAPGEGLHVVGQVFAVSQDAIKCMDKLERIGEPDGYDRLPIEVRSELIGQKSVFSVQAYLKHPRSLLGAKIMAGPLREYELAHAALYRARQES